MTSDGPESQAAAEHLVGGIPLASLVRDRFIAAQAQGLPTPAYREVERTGPDHDPEFRVTVELPDRMPAEGTGRSKRSAEQAAASVMLSREGVSTERPDG